jgi:MoaA/NifB/PqqE/SkfB family radical SAM enzyme
MKLFQKKSTKSLTVFSPSVIYLESTNICNAGCVMCPNGGGRMTRQKGYMPLDLFKRIVDECVSFEKDGLIIHLHLHGEPLFDPLLFERITYIKNILKKSRVSINTNGALLNEEKAQKLINSGIDEVIFSFNGTSEASYKKISQGINYQPVKDNVQHFHLLKRRMNANTFTILQMVTCEINQHEIDQFRQLWEGIAGSIFIKPMHNFLDMGTSTKTANLSKQQRHTCRQPFDFLVVYWNGDIGSCCWDYNNIAGIGNLKNDSLLGIYNTNKKLNKIRNSMNKMNCSKVAPCNRCSQIYGQDIQS